MQILEPHQESTQTTAEYKDTQLQRGESTATEITIYFVLLFPKKIEAKT